MRIITYLGSLQLALGGMLLLAITALATYKHPDLSVNWVVFPMGLLSLNLLVAIFINRRFRRQGGLLIFHTGLLLIIILAAVGVLMSLDGRLEITEGMEFNSHDVEIIHQGPWHDNHLDQISFTQGRVTVGYVSGLRRGDTSSRIWLADSGGQSLSRDIGDNRTLRAGGYRFITTGNKGYALILSWLSDSGQVLTGAVHMPRYPMFEWKQENAWTTPEGQVLTLALEIDKADKLTNDRAWILSNSNLQAQLRVQDQSVDRLLEPGDEIRLDQGTLCFEEVRVWMGYRIDYNPFLFWQFMAALFAITGLAVHFWNKYMSQPVRNSSLLQARSPGADAECLKQY